ncbi:unnamed protein product, partial [Laminaria digitata]
PWRGLSSTDRLFHALDSNKSGRISYDDFVVGLAVCCRGSLEEKMRFIFGVYDMNGDGLISRDELLLMLNQVPRTLLNMGADGNEKQSGPSSNGSFDNDNIADGNGNTDGGREGGGGGEGGEGAAPRLLTPHSKVFNSSRDSGAGFDGGIAAVSPPGRPVSMGRFRGSSVERGSSREAGVGGRGAMSAFTNEGIADQALGEYGSG